MNPMRCDACPVGPGRACYGTTLPALCRWAASGDPVKVAHVVNRSAIAEGRRPELAPGVVPCPPPGGKVRLPLGVKVGRR